MVCKWSCIIIVVKWFKRYNYIFFLHNFFFHIFLVFFPYFYEQFSSKYKRFDVFPSGVGAAVGTVGIGTGLTAGARLRRPRFFVGRCWSSLLSSLSESDISGQGSYLSPYIQWCGSGSGSGSMMRIRIKLAKNQCPVYSNVDWIFFNRYQKTRPC